MTYGLFDLGNSLESQSKAGLRSAAEQEHQRDRTNKALKQQKKAQDTNTVTTAAGMGIDKAYRNHLDNQAAKSASLEANPVTTTQVGGEAVQVQTLEGATGSYAQSPVATSVGTEGVVTDAIAASPVDTSVLNATANTATTTGTTAATTTGTTAATTTGTTAATTGTAAATTGAATTGAATTAATTGAATTAATTGAAVTTGAAGTAGAASTAASASVLGPVGWAVAAGILATQVL